MWVVGVVWVVLRFAAALSSFAWANCVRLWMMGRLFLRGKTAHIRADKGNHLHAAGIGQARSDAVVVFFKDGTFAGTDKDRSVNAVGGDQLFPKGDQLLLRSPFHFVVWDTKTNLEKRMMAECGACEDKMRIARIAKERNLDAIHNTVHEMAKDEARHGKGFEGLFNRYFKK